MAGAPRGENYEQEHVHEVYEQIASHFSSTRYKVREQIEARLDFTSNTRNEHRY
jgi:tRNA (uracil-5-)-methyltransferase TRM9